MTLLGVKPVPTGRAISLEPSRSLVTRPNPTADFAGAAHRETRMSRYKGRHRKPSTARTVALRTATAGALIGGPALALAAPASAAPVSVWDARRPVRVDQQLEHQHRQRLLRRPAVLPVHLGGLRRHAVRLARRPGHASPSRSPSPRRPWPARAGARGRARPWSGPTGQLGEPGRAAAPAARPTPSPQPRRGTGRRGAAPAARPPRLRPDSGSYTVRSGDTLGRIAGATAPPGRPCTTPTGASSATRT